MGHKKSGKTAFVQRLFNQIWSANGPVVPFYLEMAHELTFEMKANRDRRDQLSWHARVDMGYVRR